MNIKPRATVGWIKINMLSAKYKTQSKSGLDYRNSKNIKLRVMVGWIINFLKNIKLRVKVGWIM